MKAVVVALVGSVLSGIYWWAVFAIVYAGALFAGDRDPTSAPAADSATITTNLLTIGTAILLYAGLLLAWRRLTGRMGPAARIDS